MPDNAQESAMKAEQEQPRPYGTGYKLIGKDYSTNDQVAKVTGTAKYAEDFRAEGMLFCRLALSPMPHARVKSIRAEKALAMPGVKAILTPSDVPGHAAYMNDNGTMIKADKWGELALADEPMYQGEPILAVAAVDELTCAEAIEKIEIDMEPLPFATDPLESLRPGSSNAREDGNVWVRPAGRGPDQLTVLKWTDEDFAAEKDGRMPMGHATEEWSYGDVDAGFKNAALVLDETFMTPDVSHQCLEPRTTMAYWQNGKLFLYTGTQSTFQTVAAIARWMHMDEDKIVFISEYTGGGFGSKITGALTLVIPALLSRKLNAPVMMRVSREEEHFIGRARPGIR
jgi:CO/xanthine dehydrogenase Mo-binding subunit